MGEGRGSEGGERQREREWQRERDVTEVQKEQSTNGKGVMAEGAEAKGAAEQRRGRRGKGSSRESRMEEERGRWRWRHGGELSKGQHSYTFPEGPCSLVCSGSHTGEHNHVELPPLSRATQTVGHTGTWGGREQGDTREHRSQEHFVTQLWRGGGGAQVTAGDPEPVRAPSSAQGSGFLKRAADGTTKRRASEGIRGGHQTWKLSTVSMKTSFPLSPQT